MLREPVLSIGKVHALPQGTRVTVMGKATHVARPFQSQAHYVSPFTVADPTGSIHANIIGEEPVEVQLWATYEIDGTICASGELRVDKFKVWNWKIKRELSRITVEETPRHSRRKFVANPNFDDVRGEK